jgi:hypothetical protein
MPQIQLVYLRSAPQKVGAETIYYERIKALLEIGKSGTVRHDCLVDIGAVLPMFPERIWRSFESEVDWLYIPGSGAVLPDWVCKVTGLGAQPIECRVGKITIQVIELPLTLPTPRRSPAVDVVAKFPYDNGAYSQILLGLGGQALLGCRLVIDSTNFRAWLDY